MSSFDYEVSNIRGDCNISNFGIAVPLLRVAGKCGVSERKMVGRMSKVNTSSLHDDSGCQCGSVHSVQSIRIVGSIDLSLIFSLFLLQLPHKTMFFFHRSPTFSHLDEKFMRIAAEIAIIYPHQLILDRNTNQGMCFLYLLWNQTAIRQSHLVAYSKVIHLATCTLCTAVLICFQLTYEYTVIIRCFSVND